MKKTHKAVSEGGNPITRYQDVAIGSRSWSQLLYYEFCMLLSPIPGAFGLFLRKAFWPRLFGACGQGVAFASNIILRHPHRIHLGKRVVISEGCILDARNDENEKTIAIDDDVILSNFVMISCKNGKIRIGSHTGINAHSMIQSTNNCPVTIGKDVIIGPMCYVVGGGNYNVDCMNIPIWRQGIKQDSGVILEDDTWLGANVTVLGGVTLGFGSIAAAGAVVTKSAPERVIIGGVPAKIIKRRGKSFDKPK